MTKVHEITLLQKKKHSFSAAFEMKPLHMLGVGFGWKFMEFDEGFEGVKNASFWIGLHVVRFLTCRCCAAEPMLSGICGKNYFHSDAKNWSRLRRAKWHNTSSLCEVNDETLRV